MHLYPAVGHAYNMGEATDLVSGQRWPERIVEWMIDRDPIAPDSAAPFDGFGQ